MASRRLSNGRSPLVNQQRQITSFFSKSPSSSASPSAITPIRNPSKLDSIPNPNPSKARRGASPSPSTPSPVQSKLKKPLLVIGGGGGGGSAAAMSLSPASEKKRLFDEEVVGKRIKVYWPLDKSWYEGVVRSFDEGSGKHLVQYDDAEEESLHLAEEKIEWIEQSAPAATKFKRLRRGSAPSVAKMVIEDDEADNLEDEDDDEENGTGGDDSSDEDWDKSSEKKAVEKCEDEDEDEDEDTEMEDDEDEERGSARSKGKRDGKGSSKKRKIGGGEKLGCDKKKAKSGEIKVSASERKSNAETGQALTDINVALSGDASERFSLRESNKLRFLGEGRRDANRRRPGDPGYDGRTLYLPTDFVRSLSDGQRQWWEFKSKHMDKVLFFKMGKFYELFEMDAHVGAKELDLQYMKGDQPHCGFPERNFSMNLEKLARKGYRVLVVEQTETPEQLELRRKEKGSKDKVVKREICAVVTKGTLTEGEMISANPNASYLIALTESSQNLGGQNVERVFGVCMVDVATSRVILGQFNDDSECSALSCLLTELRPVEIVKPAKQLSFETEKVLLKHTRSPLVNELAPVLEFWDAERTVNEVKSIYKRAYDQSVEGSSRRENASPNSSCATDDNLDFLPDVLADLVRASEGGSYALSALGGTLFYLKQAFLDETLIKFAKFELLPSSGFGDVISKPYLVLDAAALESLEVFENSRNGDSAGTLYAQLNQCVTAFGKRLLKTWLARPLYHAESIRERQEAVASLRGENLSFSLEYRKALSRLPDMERLLARIFSFSEANGRNASKVVLYEDAAKKQLQEFISALHGCELMAEACSSLSAILENVESRQLKHLLTPGSGFPDVNQVLTHFKDAFDWLEANNSGRIIPHEGADAEYDSACKSVKEIESSLTKFLKEQRKLLGDFSISYVTVGKEAYLLEVPESLRGSIPRDYELRSSKKGFFRYWTPHIKKLLGELSQAENEKEASLKNILQRLIGHFCKHHTKWRQVVSTTAELDVLISLAIASDFYEGPTCKPIILSSSTTDGMPGLSATSLGHPVLRSDSLGKGSFVPNDITIGGPGNPSFLLLTGPNMGGKSTLLRQVCLSVILAQLGADVPAERFELSPVDRIFVRMGAKDHIMTGQSTFLTELSETAVMLSSATANSLVALDELGRGTSTSDGQAIAESVLEHFVHKVQCRGMFSTHYHRLSVDYQKDPKVLLGHMACQVGGGDGAVEEVTFLHRLTPGGCPKSYGVNVARIAGLPYLVLQNAAAKSREFEATYGRYKRSLPVTDNVSKPNLEKILAFFQKLDCIVSELMHPESSKRTGITSLTELQQEAQVLCEIDSR